MTPTGPPADGLVWGQKSLTIHDPFMQSFDACWNQAYQVDPCRGLSGWIGPIGVFCDRKTRKHVSCQVACRKARCHQHPVAHEWGLPSLTICNHLPWK